MNTYLPASPASDATRPINPRPSVGRHRPKPKLRLTRRGWVVLGALSTALVALLGYTAYLTGGLWLSLWR